MVEGVVWLGLLDRGRVTFADLLFGCPWVAFRVGVAFGVLGGGVQRWAGDYWGWARGGGGWHKASVSDCLPSAAPIGLSPLLILTLCGPERVLVVSTEPPDDLSCLTTPGVGRPGDGAVAGVGGGEN